MVFINHLFGKPLLFFHQLSNIRQNWYDFYISVFLNFRIGRSWLMLLKYDNLLWGYFRKNLFDFASSKEFPTKLLSKIEEIVHSEMALEEFAEHFPLPFLIIDGTGKILLSNQYWEYFSDFISGDLTKLQSEKNRIQEHCLQQIENLKQSGTTTILTKVLFGTNLGISQLEIEACIGIINETPNEIYAIFLDFDKSEIKDIHRIVATFDDLKIILDNIPYVVLVKDRNNRLIKANSVFITSFEFNTEDIEGKFVGSFLSEEVSENSRKFDREVISSRKPIIHIEERFVKNLKIEKYYLVDRVPISYDNGEVAGILIFANEITEKKQTEMELRRWKKRFDIVTSSTGQAVFERDWVSGEVIWTENIKDLFGYSAKELRKREKWLDKIVAQDLENYLETFQKHCDNLTPYNLIYRVKNFQGEQRYVKESGFFLTDDGKIVSIIGIVTDITNQRNLEQKVSDYTEFLHALLDTIPMPIFYENIEGQLIGCNKAFREEILMLSTKEFLGKTVEDFPDIFTEDFRNKHIETNQRIIEAKEIKTYDGEINLENGITKDFAIYKAGYNDFDGNLAGIINILIDITDRKDTEATLRNINLELERKIEERTKDLQLALEEYKFEVEEHRRVQEILEQANYELKILNETLSQESQKLLILNEKLAKSEQELREANSAKDKFFTIIAHDLKNPLQSILTDAEILNRFFDTFSSEKVREYVGHIFKTSNLLKNLLENLLTWTKAQTGRITFRPEWVNINLVLIDVVRFMEANANAKQIEIVYKQEIDLMVYVDRNLITTVIRNLLSNAIKFSRRGSKVNLEVQSYHDGSLPTLKVSVKDEGIGIPPDKLERLFKIEYSVTTPGTEREQGTGLGLILCKELIELHGGKIWAESEEGKGSIFTFTIPINFD